MVRRNNPGGDDLDPISELATTTGGASGGCDTTGGGVLAPSSRDSPSSGIALPPRDTLDRGLFANWIFGKTDLVPKQDAVEDEVSSATARRRAKVFATNFMRQPIDRDD